jgi:hypothetical protein
MQPEDMPSMSSDLCDFRGKLTVEAMAMLEGEAAVTGDDKSVIARRVLHAWAMRKMHAHKIAQRWLAVEGHATPERGGSGSLA